MKHRVISLILVFVLAVGLSVLPVRAAEGDWVYTQIEGGLRLDGYLGEETEITLPDTLAGQPVIEIGEGCFQNSMLTEVTIPHGIRVIGKEAFSGSKNLKKVHLGGSVNVIGERAFANTGLIKMDIPGCVRSIGKEAFLECLRLFNVVIDGGVEDWSTGIGADIGSGSVKMEEGIESIGERAFYGCRNLTRMQVPKSVKTIGSQAIGYTDQGLQSGYRITGFEGSAAEDYANKQGLEFVILESGDDFSGICGPDLNWSFDAGTGTLNIDGFGRMYDYAAAECLPWYSFRNAITTVVMGENITSVGEYAFSGSAAKQVTLPDSLAWVGTGAFAGCENLKELTFPADAPVFGANTFEHTTLTVWYHNSNNTWTQEIRQDYGGTVTWRGLDGLPFVDVPVNAFYYEPVAWALDQGITAGTDDTHFSPDNQCQRAQVVTFLWRAAGSPEPKSSENPFVDVAPSDFYYKPVLWAVEKGITNGTTATTFGPLANCNRAQVVAFLYRTVGEPAVNAGENPFVDVQEDAWYAAPVLWAVQEGITKGIDDTHFAPDNICNRAQIVAFLYRTLAD